MSQTLTLGSSKGTGTWGTREINKEKLSCVTSWQGLKGVHQATEDSDLAMQREGLTWERQHLLAWKDGSTWGQQ